MAVNDSLSQDINKLVKPDRPITPLQRVRANEAIEAVRGRGRYTGLVSVGAAVQNLRREVLTVYSSLIITEDGAFEKPLNWPTDGIYPSGAVAPNPLPASLILDAGTLSLDIDIQHYEQRRVHYLLMENLVKTADEDGNESYTNSTITEEQMYVPLAMPFLGKYFQGLIGYSSFSPALAMVVSPVTNSQTVRQVKDSLINSGVTLE